MYNKGTKATNNKGVNPMGGQAKKHSRPVSIAGSRMRFTNMVVKVSNPWVLQASPGLE